MGRDISLYDQKILLERLTIGETDAFRQLFDTWRMKLYTAALRITKSADASEDIVQEIFTRLWEKHSRLNTIQDLEAYLYTIAYHESYRYLKKVASDARLYQSLKNKMQIVNNEAGEWLEEKETKAFLDEAIAKLPAQRQRIYKLSREEGMTYQQIADQLHISPLTVKKQIVLALRSIRSSLSKVALLLAMLFFLF